MEEIKVVKLPSGAELKISICSIERADALSDAIMEEAGSITANNKFDLLKNASCKIYTSKKVRSCLDECYKTCTYNGTKISLSSFEPSANRQDLPLVRMHVVLETLAPFEKGLYAALSILLEKLESTQA